MRSRLGVLTILLVTHAVLAPALADGACGADLARLLEARLDSGNLGDVALVYEWREGDGTGDVRAELRGDGTGTLRLDVPESKPAIRERELPRDRFEKVVEAIVETGFVCLQTIPRERCLGKMGRYSVTVQVGDQVQEVWVDGFNYIEDDDAFGRVVGEFREMKDIFGREIGWGPHGVRKTTCPEM